MNKTYKKIITGEAAGTFEGTKKAFEDVISKPMWYKDIKINGFPITVSNAAQIKRRFSGKSAKSITQDYMESILIAAGYKIVQPVIWQK